MVKIGFDFDQLFLFEGILLNPDHSLTYVLLTHCISCSPLHGEGEVSSGVSCAISKRDEPFNPYLVDFPRYSLNTFWKQIVRSGQVKLPERFCWQHVREVCHHAKVIVFFFTEQFTLFGFSLGHQFVNLNISELVCLWRELWSDSWSLQCKFLENIEMRFATDTPIWNDSGDIYWQGHLGIYLNYFNVINSFLPINHNMMVLITCNWHQPTRLDKTHRLKCSMTIDYIGSWSALDLMLNLTCPENVIMYLHRSDLAKEIQCRIFFP